MVNRFIEREDEGDGGKCEETNADGIWRMEIFMIESAH
jgi:hypothetical protein